MSGAATTAGSLAGHYAAALRSYLTVGEEQALLRAYELGRQALDQGLGVLDLAAIHEGALEPLLLGPARPTQGAEAAQRAWEFFAESLSPFEMAQRGFREANLRLQAMNETLEAHSHELAAVIASISDGLLVTDQSGRIRICNPQAGDLLDVDRESLLGKEIQAAAALIDAAGGESETLSALFAQARAHPDERPSFEFRSSVPPRRDLLVELFPVALGTQPGVGIILRNITAERELARTKDELVALVSHELRQPLAAIAGYTELLLTREYDAEERAHRLATIREEIHHLRALIDDFLDLQRVDQGAARITPSELDLRPLLERAPALVPEDDRAHPLVLAVADELPLVLADGERIWQVLVNLVANARTYSPHGGEIRLTAHASEDRQAVIITVEDEGLGIPAEAIPHLFDEFFRITSPDREEIPGTGLGLAICRKIIEAHKGRIWAESPGPGRGSRLTLTLPASSTPASG